jgi:phosphoglycerol transferase MdoB-like AlkP superfamily enzyme
LLTPIARLVLASGALATAVACQLPPGSPYQRAFALEGGSPRALTSGKEITIHLTLVNTGRQAWDPARVHLSYHWLWLIPRELVNLSRTTPYHDGIRTQLGAMVAPGRELPVAGRLLAPSTPGIYWLQWDMVEEGVTWFAEVTPRQPRHLVIILPTLAGVFAALPLFVAIAGIVLLRRRVRGAPLSPIAAGFAGAADVVWCATSLFAKQLILFEEALLEPTATAYWLALVASVLPPLLLMAVLPRRARGVALFAVGAFSTLLLVGDVMYYRFFGDVVSAPTLLAANQVGRLWTSVYTLLSADLVWLVVDLPAALWLVVALARARLTGSTVRRRVVLVGASAAALALAGVAVSAPRTLRSTALDQMFRDRFVVEQLGPFGFHAFDAWTYAHATWLRSQITDAQVDEAVSWFADRAALRAGRGSPFFGLASGKSLIVVQVESLQEFVVDYRVDGQEVMPHLRRWKDGSLRFTTVIDQTSEGRTSDAELAAFASLLPTDHGAAAFAYAGNHYVGLPRVLSEHGYATLSAVPFESGFWNRRVTHRAYGFQQSLFQPDFVMTDRIGWGLNDRDFLQQMVPRIRWLPRPFCVWLITLSLHHPFEDFPDRHKTLKLGALDRTPFGNYLHTMRFFDQALEDFKSALDRDGVLDDSVLAIFGDHDAGFPHDDADANLMGIPPTEVEWALSDRVPLFVRLPRDTWPVAKPAGVERMPAGQTDFAPTLLGLLGIDAAALPYVGRNLLAAPNDAPVLRPYGDWLDRAHVFITHGRADREPSCYDVWTHAPLADARCRAADATARKTRDISRLVVTEDLQEQIRSRISQLVH